MAFHQWFIVLGLCLILGAWESIGFRFARKPALSASSSLLIGAFNVQNLGPAKVANKEVLRVIVGILERYDIILVEEIVDRDEKAFHVVLEELNRPYAKPIFEAAISPRVGRSVAKEQFAFVYRKDKVSLLKEYLYPNTTDSFEREPYVATFKPKSRAKGLTSFTLIGVHIKPGAAVEELQHLHHVVEASVKKDTPDVAVLGDFNADCKYVAKKYWPTIPLWTDKLYKWLIAHEVDTTTTPSDCTYDRIVLRGDRIIRSVVEDSNLVFRFDEEMQLPINLTLAVSDHYPVQVTLDLSASRQN